jgi:hypothetical protein
MSSTIAINMANAMATMGLKYALMALTVSAAFGGS